MKEPFVQSAGDPSGPSATFVTPLPDDHELFSLSPRSLWVLRAIPRGNARIRASSSSRSESSSSSASESLGFSPRAALLGKCDAFCIWMPATRNYPAVSLLFRASLAISRFGKPRQPRGAFPSRPLASMQTPCTFYGLGFAFDRWGWQIDRPSTVQSAKMFAIAARNVVYGRSRLITNDSMNSTFRGFFSLFLTRVTKRII